MNESMHCARHCWHAFAMVVPLLMIGVFAGCGARAGGGAGAFWPGGRQAAVCLTYDDAMTSQLANAVPDLNEFGLKGTFFVMGKDLFIDRIDAWRKVAQDGHELGNHSLFHPTDRRVKYLKPGEFHTSQSYNTFFILEEVRLTNAMLYAIDGQRVRTYAFPCNNDRIGEDLSCGYRDDLRNSGLVCAARCIGRPQVIDVRNVDFFNVPSWMITETPADKIIDLIEQARKSGGLVVLQFHGVGDEYIKINREDHRKLLAYLHDHRDGVWTAPFREAMTYAQNRLAQERAATRPAPK